MCTQLCLYKNPGAVGEGEEEEEVKSVDEIRSKSSGIKKSEATNEDIESGADTQNRATADIEARIGSSPAWPPLGTVAELVYDLCRAPTTISRFQAFIELIIKEREGGEDDIMMETKK